ncbi:phage terminase large subunit [Variovorax guangxiensis]|uniref:Terminase n=1 Tax=Variovorax guangxiensis TaxID=1775474 RepID=A0A502E161_9BURK|nr:phage terminase large subunit [Variovorax guangxiensis]TPG26526.1 terminase [Variovorax ginsengisoli]TPG30251.1 terminase [Variovorax guangxiensis]
MAAEASATVTVIKPQPGPQERFLSSPADIATCGGAAGGGKSWALLLEPLRHVTRNPEFAAVFFRRNTVQVRNPGGLWDESAKLYPVAGGTPTQHVLEWKWAKGGRVNFAHLEHESTVYDWQGSQIPRICFDELTHFTKAQFVYMLSRNRSMSGIKPYIRASTNPDADSWVAEFISWWINQDTGLPYPERSGVVRWFVRINDATIWGDSVEELRALHGDDVQPKSVTFIAAKLSDNQALMKADPGYGANLAAQNAVERARLADGNWKIRPASGLYFKRHWVKVVEAAPADLDIVRGWDLAATEKTDNNDPDWTSGVKLGRSRSTGRYIILHRVALRAAPHTVEQTIMNTAAADGRSVIVRLPQDPGQAGKSQAQTLVIKLAGYIAKTTRPTGDKIVRFSPFSAQCEAGNVDVLRGPWNGDLYDNLEAFPEAAHDDDVDACSEAFGHFVNPQAGIFT